MSDVTTEEVRKVALALDEALERRDVEAVTEKFTEDCEIELLGIKLFGMEGARRWVNWMYSHVAELKFVPVTIMVEGSTFFEEFVVEAKFHDGEAARSNQTVVLEFESLKIKSLRMYFDRLDFSGAVAKDVVSKIIVRELIKKSLEGLT